MNTTQADPVYIMAQARNNLSRTTEAADRARYFVIMLHHQIKHGCAMPFNALEYAEHRQAETIKQLGEALQEFKAALNLTNGVNK